jgi:hypothetical protein
MLDNQTIDRIKEHLFSSELNIYAVIDGAACPELRFKIYDWEPKSVCLWSGDLEPDMQEVAPYMVLLDRDSTFTDWLISQGWNNNWNIFINTELDFKAFRKQIRKLLLVKSPKGQDMVFRFYDPRVFKVFKESWNEEQVEVIFLNIDSIIYQLNDSCFELVSDKGNTSTSFYPAIVN